MKYILRATILVLVTLLQYGALHAQVRGPQLPPPRTQAAAPRTQPPLTLKQVIESLSSLKSSKRVEDLISRRGVQFEAGPGVLDILKEFGASAKLLSMIPAPPAPVVVAKPPEPIAGAFTVVCEPVDCAVIVDDMYKGPTAENRKTLTGLHPGEATIVVFANGYDDVTRKIQLQAGTALEEKFSLKRNTRIREQSAGASLLRAVAGIGGIDGVAEFGDIEGAGTMVWTNNSGQKEEWSMTFNKRIGKDLVVTFKTRNGQCVASISAQSAKQDCKGELKNSGEKIAEQAASLFLSYQLQDVMQTLLKRKLVTSESDENRLESVDGPDAYALLLGNNSLPTDLIYRVNDASTPIQVRYSNYMTLNNGRYPGRITTGRLNAEPVFVFTVNTLRTKVGRSE
jgi:hypothetical protein